MFACVFQPCFDIRTGKRNGILYPLSPLSYGSAYSRQQKPHRIDYTFVGIYPWSCNKHRFFAPHAHLPKCPHSSARHSYPHRLPKIRFESFRTFFKKRHVHIAMRPVVILVNQAGFGCRIQFIQQRHISRFAKHLLCVAAKQLFRHPYYCLFPVCSASRALHSRPRAYKAFPPVCTGKFPFIAYNIHIKQSCSREFLLYALRYILDLFVRHIRKQISFRSCRSVYG